ncbi:MAG: tetratricopeptide repeat protein [Candidatus Sericytochromatia bacterium]|nr:tetratricopeptide repeat protein [Candidatus Sericytochromatia bacterium]
MTEALPAAQQAWQLYQNALLLVEQGSHEEAMRELVRALVHFPGLWQAHFQLGLLQQRLGQPAQALGHFHHFLEKAPADASERGRALCMVGQILQQKGHSQEAYAALIQALKAQPPDPFAHFYLGELHYRHQAWDQAMAHYSAFLKTHTDKDHLVWRIQIRHRQAQILQLRANPELLQKWRQELNEPSDGPLISLSLSAPLIFDSLEQQDSLRKSWKTEIEALAQQNLTIFNPLWELDQVRHFQWAHGPQNVRSEIEAGQALLHRILPDVDQLPSFPDNEFRTPRLGIWCNFSAGLYRSILPLLLQLFQDYQVLLLAASPMPEELLKNSDVQVMVFPKNLETQRSEILRLELDLLLYTDLGPQDLNSLLLAHYRLAPIQAVLPGYPVTSGIPTIDYYLSSQLWEPQTNAQDAYTEKLVLLEGTPFGKPNLPDDLLDRDHFNLPQNQTVYLVPVNASFLHPDFDALLKGILAADPQALVLALGHRYALLNQQLRNRWQRTLGEQAPRMQLLPSLSQTQLLSLVKAADLVLDPFYFGLGAQAFSFLALGTPLITWPGQFQRGRYAFAAYQLLEIEDTLANSADDYLAKALELGRSPEKRAELRQRILTQAHQLDGYVPFLRSLRGFILGHIQREF